MGNFRNVGKMGNDGRYGNVWRLLGNMKKYVYREGLGKLVS